MRCIRTDGKIYQKLKKMVGKKGHKISKTVQAPTYATLTALQNYHYLNQEPKRILQNYFSSLSWQPQKITQQILRLFSNHEM